MLTTYLMPTSSFEILCDQSSYVKVTMSSLEKMADNEVMIAYDWKVFKKNNIQYVKLITS